MISKLCLITLAFVGVSSIEIVSPTGETFLGELKTIEHDISGKLFALDEKTLVIKNFVYDGKAPDAFFWAGTEGAKPQDEGKISPYSIGNGATGYSSNQLERLEKKFDGSEDVKITLPGNLKVSDLKWFSIWCRKYSVNMGEFIFPGTKSAAPVKAAVPFPAQPATPFTAFAPYTGLPTPYGFYQSAQPVARYQPVQPIQPYVPAFYYNPYFAHFGR